MYQTNNEQVYKNDGIDDTNSTFKRKLEGK